MFTSNQRVRHAVHGEGRIAGELKSGFWSVFWDNPLYNRETLPRVTVEGREVSPRNPKWVPPVPTSELETI